MASKADVAVERPIIDAFTDTSTLAAQHGINENKFVRRLDLRILPVLSFLYLLSFLDRSNVGNARIEGLTADLQMTGDQYLTGLTLFFVGYVVFEVPANIVLKVWRPNAWLALIALVWGVVSTLQGVVQSRQGFLVVRFFLGMTEAGLFPGIVYYLSMWYKRNERQYRVALFFSAASLAGAFGGVLAWGIAHMNGVGGYAGWRWIFIIEGVFTVVVAAASYFAIYNYPDTARFLRPKEREFVQARLEADSDATQSEGFAWAEVRKAFTDYKVYLYALGFHTLSLPLYTLSLFLPTIIKTLGYSAAKAQLLTVPPYAVAFILTVGLAVLSEKTRVRAPIIVGSSAVAILGYVVLLSDARPGPSYVGVFLAAGGIYPAVALVLAWPANNVSGQTKRAVANAMQIMIGNLGAVIGTQLYRSEDSPRFFLGHGFALGYLVANVVVVSVLWVLLRKENAKRDALLQTGQADNEKLGPGLEEHGDFTGDSDPRWRFHL